LALDLVVNLGGLLGLGELSSDSLLALVVCRTLNLASFLESGNNILVFPADFVAETANGAVLATGLEAEHTESLGNNNTLLLVVWGRDTLKDLESLQGSGTTGGLVRNHAADGLVENARRGTEVEGTTTGRVETGGLAEVGMVLQLSAEEFAGDVEGFTSNDDNLLTVEQLLSHNAGQATQEVSLAVDNDLYRR
jgi:hypothetical protein